MEQQQAARSSGDDYRDEDDLDTVPLTSPDSAVITEFFPVSDKAAAGLAGGQAARDGTGPTAEGQTSGGDHPRDDGWVPATDPAATGASVASMATVPPVARSRTGSNTGPDLTPRVGPNPESQARARRQTEGAPAPIIPDCCNSGPALRTIVVANLAALVLVAAQATSGAGFGQTLLSTAMLLEPALFGSLIALCVVRRWANGQPLRLQWIVGIGVPVLLTGALATGLARVALPDEPERWLAWTSTRMLLAGAMAAALLEYFRLRARAYAPSFSEARLQALQARIRPHFLFNSLNAVLGLIRTDPRRAEHTLENLADLFRVFMRDAREMVPLDDEVLTCKEYLAIEQLRLTDRLKVVWDIDEMPGDALIPSLLLQPLLENAVHHGIEPLTVQGTLNIRITHPGDRVRVDIDNPISTTPAPRSGNQMALSNVKERLMLLYDLEADLKTSKHEGRFHLHLEFPYRKERRRRDVRRHHIHPDR